MRLTDERRNNKDEGIELLCGDPCADCWIDWVLV